METGRLDAVNHLTRFLAAHRPIAGSNHLAEIGPVHDDVLEVHTVGKDLVEDDPADRGIDKARLGVSSIVVLRLAARP